MIFFRPPPPTDPPIVPIITDPVPTDSGGVLPGEPLTKYVNSKHDNTYSYSVE